jgi:PKD repeat protein
MKVVLLTTSVLFVLLGCQNKENKVQPIPAIVPDATILVVNVNESNTAAFTFSLNNIDSYSFDFGDGSTLTDSLPKDAIKLEYQRISHQYTKNGNYTVTLTVKNRSHTSQSQTIVEARRIAIADFSYDILENGQVKLKNLSENRAENYLWRISLYPLTNGNYYIYKSSDKEPVLKFDVNGKYKIKLQAINGNTSEVEKDIEIRNAGKQMSFSGYYNGEKISVALDKSDFYYYCSYPTGKISQILGKDREYQPLFWRDYYLPPYTSKEEKYIAIREFIKTKDIDVVELKEETLDPELYNNSASVYPKALWITYKVKTEQLDGELKIRLLILEYSNPY